MYKKIRQALAIVAIAILVSMYLVTLILAIALPANAMKMFYAAVILTVFIPIILWIILASVKLALRNREETAKENAEAIQKASRILDEMNKEEINKEEIKKEEIKKEPEH